MNHGLIRLVGIETEDMSFVVIDPDHSVVVWGHFSPPWFSSPAFGRCVGHLRAKTAQTMRGSGCRGARRALKKIERSVKCTLAASGAKLRIASHRSRH